VLWPRLPHLALGSEGAQLSLGLVPLREAGPQRLVGFPAGPDSRTKGMPRAKEPTMGRSSRPASVVVESSELTCVQDASGGGNAHHHTLSGRMRELRRCWQEQHRSVSRKVLLIVVVLGLVQVCLLQVLSVHGGISSVVQAQRGRPREYDWVPSASGYNVSSRREWPRFPEAAWGGYFPNPSAMRPPMLRAKESWFGQPLGQRRRHVDGVVERLVPIEFRVDQAPIWQAEPRETWRATEPPTEEAPQDSASKWRLQKDKGWAIVCRQFDLSELPPLHVVEFEPLLTDPWDAVKPTATGRRAESLDPGALPDPPGPGKDIVHHMTIMLCTRPKGRHPMGETFDCDANGVDDVCSEILIIYDRGGRAFRLPENTGARIGTGGEWDETDDDWEGLDELVEGDAVRGSPYRYAILEVHYLPALLPVGSIPEGGFLDSSGLRLWVTPDFRPHDAKFIGLSDEDIALQPGSAHEEDRFVCPAETLGHQLRGPFLKHGRVSVFAFHLHAHALARELELTVLRANENQPGVWEQLQQVLGKLQPFGGYNQDQSLFYPALRGGGDQQPHARYAPYVPSDMSPMGIALEAVEPGGVGEAPQVVPVDLFPGDTLAAHCVYSTTTRTQTVHYGLGLHDEMCAPVAWVYPLDGTTALPRHPDSKITDESILRNVCVYTPEHVKHHRPKFPQH
jgi:hypothetical protein